MLHFLHFLAVDFKDQLPHLKSARLVSGSMFLLNKQISDSNFHYEP